MSDTQYFFSKAFKKQLSKLPRKIQNKFKERLEMFCGNNFDNELRNHQLKGKLKGFRSIDISGDYRAVYFEAGEGIIIFEAVGTHSQLYK